MGTGNLISSLPPAFLPPRSPSAAFVPFSLGGLLRRVSGWELHLLLSRKHRGAGVLSSPATPVVPRLPPAPRVGSGTAAVSRFRPCQRFVPPLGTQATALRSYAASLLHTVCAMLSPIMLLPSSAPNPALNLAPCGRWTLRDKAAQRRLALR